MRCDVRAGFAQINVLIDMIDPENGKKRTILAIGGTTFRELDVGGNREMVDLAERLEVARNDVHVALTSEALDMCDSET
jgi:hypothetical protein